MGLFEGPEVWVTREVRLLQAQAQRADHRVLVAAHGEALGAEGTHGAHVAQRLLRCHSGVRQRVLQKKSNSSKKLS
jgi:hypothetical protein